MSQALLTLALISLLLKWLGAVQGQNLGSQPPVFITEVHPPYGSMAGGTTLELHGGNFMMDMNTRLIIFVGNTPCIVDEYHTSADKAVCTTPACGTTYCVDNPVNFAMFFDSHYNFTFIHSEL